MDRGAKGAKAGDVRDWVGTEICAALARGDVGVIHRADSDHYPPEECEDATLADFHNRKRWEKESVEDFGQALQSLAGKAFPDTAEKALERMVISQFTAGMEEEDLRKHINFGRAKRMNKAISLAVEWMSFSSKDKDKVDAPMKPKVASAEVNSLASSMEVLTARLDRIEEGWKSRPRANKSTIVCYGCGEMGYF